MTLAALLITMAKEADSSVKGLRVWRETLCQGTYPVHWPLLVHIKILIVVLWRKYVVTIIAKSWLALVGV